MNYVNIMGGLGNQLFQYTFAKYLETLTGYPVILHIGFFDIGTVNPAISSRSCSLDRFNTEYHSTKEQVKIADVVTDETFSPESVKDNILLNGYWQDKKYFTKVHDLISGELKLKHEFITDDMRRIASQMHSDDSVAIHVRRKDYLNQFNKDIFYEISLEYYAAAVKHISKVLGHNPVLYIFSDDQEYISSNMDGFCDCRTVLMAPRRDYEDLYLMSQAKHHIIANSTYSWWGAVLSEYEEGITIAPKHWFKDRKDPDLYFENWIIIDNHIDLDKISVIIPAYNVEKYVDRCLKSLEDQTYDIKNLEIILIDDASTDDTLKHLESFEATHPENVMLIKLAKNSGQGAARNIGLSYATGRYITFIDSDDLIDISMLYKMVSKAEEYGCDIVECGYKQFSDKTETVISEKLSDSFYLGLKDADSRRKLIILTCSKTSVWGRLYKKDFIDNNRVRFIEHIFFEDIQFSGLLMFMASSYYRINEPLYCYYSNAGGTVFSKYQKDRVRQEAAATELFLAELSERDMLYNIVENFRNELSIYCTTKAFIDPLTLLINSNLGINEVLSEISYFKEKLLDIFPDAASLYSLSDKYGICDLGIHLLTSNTSMTERQFIKTSEKDNIIINVFDNHKPDPGLYSSLISVYPDIETHNSINIPYADYAKEHLLLRHAISTENTIIIIVGRYLSPVNQSQTNMRICTIINEYPDNKIILKFEHLYYDESDECLGNLSTLIECLTSHKKAIIFLHDLKSYHIGCTLMPSADIRMF